MACPTGHYVFSSATIPAAIWRALASSVMPWKRAPTAGVSPDFEKMMKGLQNNISDQFRKMAGSNFKYDGAGGDSVDVGALMARNANTAPLESNIKDTTIKEQSAQGVRDKLSKLRSLRGGDKK